MTTMIEPLQAVADRNEEHVRAYRASSLIVLLEDPTTPVATKNAVLAYLAPWSNAFQRMISVRAAYETDPQLKELALEHQQEEVGHDGILADSHDTGRTAGWDPVIEAGAAWFVDQLRVLPGLHRVVLAHLVLEAGSLAFSNAGSLAFPGNTYFALHDEEDQEHIEMGYRLLTERQEWELGEVMELLDQAWQVITMVSDRIAELALRDTVGAA
ncbi:hypothetical protein [Streptacidiphilus fuscans]|uniref:Iron-containing redox enzyme family protein n=1 Tax=Streptacidiphilus fuscans TaxID=2789292 RepID=A0A931FH18_9ACTN|nr:hypothetical protein [Streptacidiphilus fuscans]MBF9070174.1 hypothetical protein [Streptacidiphilus fuscans]